MYVYYYYVLFRSCVHGGGGGAMALTKSGGPHLARRVLFLQIRRDDEIKESALERNDILVYYVHFDIIYTYRIHHDNIIICFWRGKLPSSIPAAAEPKDQGAALEQ